MSEGKWRFHYRPKIRFAFWRKKVDEPVRKTEEEVAPDVAQVKLDLANQIKNASLCRKVVDTEFWQLFLSHMEELSEKEFKDFKTTGMTKETYIHVEEIMKNIAEYPLRLIYAGNTAVEQLNKIQEIEDEEQKGGPSGREQDEG